MNLISNWYNKVHKNYQRETTGGYDTFCTFRKSKGGKRIQHKRARRKTEQEKFYEGFEEFVENNRHR